MIEGSRVPGTKADVIEEVSRRIAEMQDSTTAFDEAAASYLGVNFTDLLCLRLILQGPSLTPGELATAVGRTPAAITVVIDRLETAGLAERTRDPADRRRLLVGATARAAELISVLWGPLETEGVALLATFPTEHLEAFLSFLGAGIDLQHQHAQRIRELERPENAGS